MNQMRLTQVRIQNFRGIEDLTVDLDETTVLIGENNTGKTAFLQAIRLSLQRLSARGKGPFSEYDYHLSSDRSTPTAAKPIQINLVFSESASQPWDDEVETDLSDVITFVAGSRRIELRVTSFWDEKASDFQTDWEFLDDNGDPLLSSNYALRGLRQQVPTFYLSALRDASRHFISSGRYWRTFLGEAGVPEADKADLERQLAVLNSRVIKANRPLAEVRDYLDGQARKVVDLGSQDAVAISALPTRLFSLLSRAQVLVDSASGASIPVERQGEGTQSLAVLLVFGAFLRSQLSGVDPAAVPVIALEEPEAHLHPSAVRSLMGVVTDLPGQKIVSTHSGALLASVAPVNIRRLAHVDGSVKSFQITKNTLTPEDWRKFDIHVRRTRGEMLFARCWLLVEGETEAILYEGAAQALDLDIVRGGVCCVQFAQSGVGMLANVANQLGIEWYGVLDGDSGRRKYESHLRQQIGDAPESDRIAIPYAKVEMMLCQQGFGDVYEAGMSSQKASPTSPKNTSKYWKEVLAAIPNQWSKPRAAARVVELLTDPKNPRPVPPPLKRILDTAVRLAEK